LVVKEAIFAIYNALNKALDISVNMSYE